MSSNWIYFIVLVGMGFIDLVLGIVLSRTPAPPVGAPPPAGGEERLRARRLTGRIMLGSALFFWAFAAACATGHVNPDLALPMFAGKG